MEDQARSVRGYRARAKQIREEADAMPNLETKQALLAIAAHYDRLASRVEITGDRSTPDEPGDQRPQR